MWKKWLKRALWFFSGVFLLFAIFIGWVYWSCESTPPTLSYEPTARGYDAPTAPDAQGRVHFGPNWFQKARGRSLLYVEGDPYSIGFANATLTHQFLEEQERALLDSVQEHLPSRAAFWTIYLIVRFNNRNLQDYVKPEYREEILGLADAGVDLYPEYGSLYHRILNYHAAHDIGHWVHDKPVIGCTAFAVVGPRSKNGSLLVGRNFDFEAGRGFDVNKIIGCYRPKDGHAFLSVAWPGMAGAVTGINDQRIFCSLNGAHSADINNIGTPVSLVIRELLQYATTLEDAIRIIRESRVFVSDSYLVADGKTGHAAVVEKTPERCAVRYLKDNTLIQANHFETAELKDDEGNREYMSVGSSVRRRKRIGALLRDHTAPLDAEAAVAILRDTRGLGDSPIALGNRGTINPCICTHSVVADVTRGLLWVSRGPHQLGAYDAYSIERFGSDGLNTIDASPLLENGRYEALQTARLLIASGTKSDLKKALVLVPGSLEALVRLAKLLDAEGDRSGALRIYREALAAQPAYDGQKDAIEGAIARLSDGS
jgi:isopenicillin-N N-acyltransferase-like protein